MARHFTDFVVDTRGHCFLCLKTVTLQFVQVKVEPGSEELIKHTTHSFQFVSSYLKMEMSKVFSSEPGSISADLVEKVNSSKLKVSLCEECVYLSEKVSGLCRQLEKIEIEVTSNLNQIYGKLKESDEACRIEQLRKLDDLGGWKERLAIVEVLREEAMQKCSKYSRPVQPRVKVQNLSLREIEAQKSELKASALPVQEEISSECHSPDLSDADPDFELNDADDDADSNYSNDQYAGAGTTAKSTVVETERSKIKIPKLETGEPKFTISSTTGKFRCQVCSREYSTKYVFNYHYQSVHLNIRYNCTKCKKVFHYKNDFQVHQKRVHMGDDSKPIHECVICKKVFERKVNLMAHRQTAHFGRYKCKFCSQSFTNAYHKDRHLRTCRLQNKSQNKFRKVSSSVAIVKKEMDEEGDLSDKSSEDELDRPNCQEEGEIAPSKVGKKRRAKYPVEVIVPKNSPGAPNIVINPLNGRHECGLCSKTFASDVGFKYHYERFHLKMVYRCKLCRKTFVSQKQYSLHHRSVHLELNLKVRCSACPKSFLRKCDLNSHFEAVHSRPPACDICGKSYARKNDLNRHKRREHK